MHDKKINFGFKKIMDKKPLVIILKIEIEFNWKMNIMWFHFWGFFFPLVCFIAWTNKINAFDLKAKDSKAFASIFFFKHKQNFWLKSKGIVGVLF